MPKDQTKVANSYHRFRDRHTSTFSNWREGENRDDGRIGNERVRRRGQAVEPLPPTVFQDGPIFQVQLTNPNIARQSFFESAQDFQIQHFQVIMNSPPNLKPVDGWELLVKNISPNALLDSSARYDAPKCDEDTRVEVTSKLMDWIGDRANLQVLLCMTGAAGSGKSALQQTVAERCAKLGILGSAYFFSNTDPTRNTTSTVVPTIAFQLGSHHPDLKRAISAAVAQDPVIFEKSVRVQMDRLVVHPLTYLQDHGELDLATLPYVILIDGLDECKNEDRQANLLHAIRECLLTNGLPFRIFITSRLEWAIRTALSQGGHLHASAYHLQLSNHYNASGDMRRYLRGRFEQLSPRTGNPHWFTEQNIETLVRAGSGQFIYVATVYRYISQPRASPAERLKIVLAWTPHDRSTAQPFERLDKLYTDILLAAKNAYEAVDTHSGWDFLLLLKIHHVNVTSGFPNPGLSGLRSTLSNSQLTARLCLEAESTKILFSDLNSLVAIKEGAHQYLRVFHKSFSDFLNSESRAKDLFVPLDRVYEHLAKCCLFTIIQSSNSDSSVAAHYLPVFWTAGPASIDDELIDFTQKGGWHKIDSVTIEFKANFSNLLQKFGPLTASLENRAPEVVAVMRWFLTKWKCDYEEFVVSLGKERKEREGLVREGVAQPAKGNSDKLKVKFLKRKERRREGGTPCLLAPASHSES